ncbi:MAG: hydantoinase B/oxoprolinase family protein [Myxococcales bacterium]|nr:hydantoinase B/oxoprolinase family protein [Myxococcota bacterium]MDW8282109.1 hydantoinase B/oxoprolinase family protein [Myxococcales bacterium]
MSLPTPISLSIWQHRLSQVAEEMGATLRRSALSPNIKERRDYSCAICDDSGRLLAQAAHIPVHLGSTAMAVRAVLRALRLGPDDVAIVNDPYSGGTHLPDVTLVAPVCVPGAGGTDVLAYLAVRAHHADVGGLVPGSMGVPTRAEGDEIPEAPPPSPAVGPRYRAPQRPVTPLTIDDEGLRLPPTLLTAEVEQAFVAHSRSPWERLGDLRAQRAALLVGQRRLQELAAHYGAEEIRTQGQALIEYAARMTRASLAALPSGTYAFADSLDDDGGGVEDIAIRVRITLEGGQALVDFSDSDEQVGGPVNTVLPVTVSAVLYAFRLLLPEELPTNEGCLEPITIIAPTGSVVNACPPHAVSAGNTETAQRIVDVILGALHQAVPDRVPAASCGSMNSLLVGNERFVYYETIAGGAGASAHRAGAHAVHTHMTNTRNTPVEVLEQALPMRVLRYAVRRGSGGAGRHRGGDGVVRTIELLEDATVTLLGERRRRPPYGQRGGAPGALGRDWLRRGERVVLLPGKVSFQGRAGDVLTIETPGGGGYGDPSGGAFWGQVLPPPPSVSGSPGRGENSC